MRFHGSRKLRAHWPPALDRWRLFSYWQLIRRERVRFDLSSASGFRTIPARLDSLPRSF